MRRLSQRARARHDISDLPLFAWAAARTPAPLSPAARWVMQHYPVPASLAVTVAQLAGLGDSNLDWEGLSHGSP